jgi:hypothetical protein
MIPKMVVGAVTFPTFPWEITVPESQYVAVRIGKTRTGGCTIEHKVVGIWCLHYLLVRNRDSESKANKCHHSLLKYWVANMASVASKSTGQEAPVPPEAIPYDYCMLYLLTVVFVCLELKSP